MDPCLHPLHFHWHNILNADHFPLNSFYSPGIIHPVIGCPRPPSAAPLPFHATPCIGISRKENRERQQYYNEQPCLFHFFILSFSATFFTSFITTSGLHLLMIHFFVHGLHALMLHHFFLGLLPQAFFLCKPLFYALPHPLPDLLIIQLKALLITLPDLLTQSSRNHLLCIFI